MQEQVTVKDVDVIIEGQGTETIVMVHGWPDTHKVWDQQVDALKDKFRCVRFTLPGYALDKPRKYYDLDAVMEAINAVVDEVSNGEKVTLMLHDWGCFFGYQFYMRNKEKVSKIIGVDIGDAGSPDHILTTKAKLFMFAYQMWLATAWKIGGNIGDRMTRKMASLLNAPGEPSTITSAMTYSYYWKWSNTLTGKKLGNLPVDITCPLLFVYGNKKVGMFHSQPWEEKMALIPGNRVEAFETNHWVMVEQPEKFNRITAEWLESQHQQSDAA